MQTMINEYSDNGDILKFVSSAERQEQFASVFEEMRKLGHHAVVQLIESGKATLRNVIDSTANLITLDDSSEPSTSAADIALRQRSERMKRRYNRNVDIRF